MKCATCRWFDPDRSLLGAVAVGVCRFNPPTAGIIMAPNGMPQPVGMFPTVDGEQWCREWTPERQQP